MVIFMKIAISGTYSTGKTTTTLALSYYTNLSQTHAKTMREILPKALPGKRLEDVTGPELVQLGIRRLMERAVRESHLEWLSPRHIEVAQCDKFCPIGFICPTHDLFHHQLTFTVRVDRILWITFHDRHLFRNTISCCS